MRQRSAFASTSMICLVGVIEAAIDFPPQQRPSCQAFVQKECHRAGSRLKEWDLRNIAVLVDDGSVPLVGEWH